MDSRRVPFRLLLVTDRQLCKDRTLSAVVREAIAGGVDGVQLREKDLTASELFNLAGEILEVTGSQRVPLLINDRIDVVLAARAQGVHLATHSLPIREARSLVGSDLLVGRSVHSLEEALQAQTEGADYVLFGPIFSTPAKVKYGPPQGVKRLQEVSGALRIPVLAIGGINRDTASLLPGSGLAGIAVISAIQGAHDPCEAARELAAIARRISI